MADDSIVIKIDLDTGEIKKQVSEIESELSKTAESTEEKFNNAEKGISSTTRAVQQLNIKISQTNRQLADVGDTTKEINKSMTSGLSFDKIVGGISALAGGLAVVAANGEEIKQALKNLGVTFQPIYRIIDAVMALGDQFANLTGIEAFNKVFSDSNDILFAALKALYPLPAAIAPVAGSAVTLATAFSLLKNNGAAVTQTFVAVKNNAQSLGGIFTGIGNVFLGNIKNIFALTSALAGVAAGLALFGQAFERSNNEVLRISATISTFAAFIVGGFAAALSFAIIKVGELAFNVGSKLVQSAQNATNIFLSADRSLAVFSATIENFNRVTGNAIGTSEDWSILIDELSSKFNLSTLSLQKSAAEIINVGSQLGLNSDQLKELANISAEYAAINKKDVFDTTVALVSALNGQSQAVLSLGLKLGEQSNVLFTLKNNYKKTFDQLSEGEKVQVRYNNLLKQFSNVAGIGVAASSTLGAQTERLENNIEKLNIKLGRGAAIIEDFNIVSLASNKVLESFGDTSLAVAGFLGAFGARILQVGGLLLEYGFKIYALIKAYSILNVILAADITKSAFGKSLPFLNMSIQALADSLAGVPVKLDSAKNAFTALGLIIRNQGDVITKVLFGVNTASLTLGNSITVLSTVITTRILPALRLIGLGLARVAIAFWPITLAVTAVVGVFKLFQTAIQEINARSSVLSRTIEVLSEPLLKLWESTSILKVVFTQLGEIMTNVFQRSIGIVAFGVLKLLEAVTFLAAKNPFNIFSKTSVARLKDIKHEIQAFNEQLIASGFNMDGFAKRSIASSEALSRTTTVNLESLRQLQDELKNVGKSQIKILEEQRDSRLGLLRQALQEELLSEKAYAELRLLVLQDFADKKQEILDKTKATLIEFDNVFFEGFGIKFGTLVESSKDQLERFAQVGMEVGARIQQALGQIATNGIQRFTRSLITGKNAFKDFGKYILGTIGELATQMGTLLLTAGIGMLALGTLNPMTAIIAGAALIAIGEVFKALSGGSGENAAAAAAAPGGVGGDFGPGPSAPTTEVAGQRSQIIVNIQGDVLDSDQTGMRIVNLIQEYADRNGSVEVMA